MEILNMFIQQQLQKVQLYALWQEWNLWPMTLQLGLDN
jgi:hypothetical protein